MAKTKRSTFDHTIEGRLEEVDYGRMTYWVVFLPPRLEAQRPFLEQRKLRMRGEVAGRAVSLAWQLKGGRHYVMFGKTLAKALGLVPGSKVSLSFSLVPDDEVDVPAELREALRQEATWQSLWRALTPGKRRGLAHLVGKVKSPDLRAQRAVELLRSLEDGVVPGPPPRRRSG